MLRFSLKHSLIQVLLLWGLAPGLSAAAEAVGTVFSVRGTVTAIQSGSRIPLHKDDRVFVKQRITADDKSYVVLQFLDGARLTLVPRSSIVIESYQYDQSEQDSAVVGLKSGGLRISPGAMAESNPGGFKVRSPVALMTVRGPEFILSLCGNQICTDDNQ